MSSVQLLSRRDQEKLLQAQQNLIQQRQNNKVSNSSPNYHSKTSRAITQKIKTKKKNKENLNIDKILIEAKEKMQSELGKLGRKIRQDRIKRNLTVYSAFLKAANLYLQQNTECDPKHFSSVCFFTVLEIISAITGYACSTCELAFKDLRETNLIATKREYQKTTFEKSSKNVCIGVWLCVNLRPKSQYRPMILDSETPAESPRNLQLDRKNKLTAWELKKQLKKEVGGSFYLKGKEDIYKYLLLWALPNLDKTHCVKKDPPTSFQSPLDAVEDAINNINQTHPKKRPEKIEQAAYSISKLLNDHNHISIMSYCKMLWDELKNQNLDSLLHAIKRTYIYKIESHQSKHPLRKPGAYLRSLLYK